jgi:acyl-CoA synthetase (AMP-forming)/AMP-acid ligase II
VAATLVHQFLEEQARERPDHELLVLHDPGAARLGYGAVAARAQRVARLLRDTGVGKGDRVAILAHNGIEYVAAWFAALQLGAIAVPVNTASDPASLGHVVADCAARALVVGPRLERVVVAAGARLAGLATIVAAGAPAARQAIAAAAAGVAVVPLADADSLPPGPIDAAIGADDAAAIIYTSGSTGRPRGATLTHKALVANARSIVGYLGLVATDRVLVVLPFHYVYGKSLLTTATAVGATLVVENRFQYPATALDTLAAERCTGLAGVPSTFAILVHRAGLASRALPDLAWVTQAGGGMSPALTRALIEALPGKRIHVMYGATEASARLAHLPPDELAGAIGSIGRAIPGVELTVRRPDGAPCDVDEVGELHARGDNIMTGYWNDPEETARVLGPHGYATGDLARRDAADRLWLVGRKKDLLKVAGHRVSAKEIEDAIAEHPAVLEVAVIGIPDELLGDKLRAFVVVRDGATLEAPALGAFLKDRIAAYKIPDDIQFRTDLPRSSAGKVLKEALRGS